ncbi:MAG TPA: VTT domain-containing protein [Candidatus Paceibacterota bacterium]
MENKTIIADLDSKPEWGQVLRNLFFIFVTIAIAYWVTVKIGVDDLRSTVEAAGIIGPLIIILLKATTLIIVPLGGGPIYVVAGAVFGFWKALVITLIGDILGSVTCFYLSRIFGIKVLNFFVPRKYIPTVQKIIEKGSDKKTFFKTRIFFTGFPELFAYASGFTKISVWFFILVHNSIHLIPSALMILFGYLVVSSGSLGLLLVGLVTFVLALAGVWWFNLNLKQAA